MDGTDGINVFNGSSNFGYTVTEGDLVHVSGIIDQFNGLTQIVPDTLTLEDTGLELMDPLVITELNESTESQMVTIRCVSLVDPTEWT
ncbi:MAG: hypothetical protein HRT74_07000, partial [Flavobacteriales bacterium]|nr:hypothetical protein [Flavobacteriales bacterium]